MLSKSIALSAWSSFIHEMNGYAQCGYGFRMLAIYHERAVIYCGF